MLKGLYTAYTGMLNEQHRMDVTANNLANATTNGYKKEGATAQAFDDVLAYKIKDMSEGYGLTKREGIMNPGVKIGEGYTDFSEGSFKTTDKPLDLALAGKGFFAVQHKDSEGNTSTMYTRDGNFTLDAGGYLVTQDGDYVLDRNNSRIQCDPLRDITINEAGQIYQSAGGTGNRLVTTLQVADFEDYNYLEHYGENFYVPVEGANRIDSTAKVESGFLEGSNISVVTEMVNMIAIQRQYEANQKVITTYDSSLEIAANQLGKL